jgi:hypothetical protein
MTPHEKLTRRRSLQRLAGLAVAAAGANAIYRNGGNRGVLALRRRGSGDTASIAMGRHTA